MPDPTFTPSPTVFGAPPEFSSWRPQQEDAFIWALSRSERHVGMSLATGTGKSLISYLLGKAAKGRTIILTSRIGLANQYKAEFPGIKEIHARRNYYTEEQYKEALASAIGAPIVVTNYQFYFYSVLSGRLGSFATVVCDEAAVTFRELSNFMSVNIEKEQIKKWGIVWPTLGDIPQDWRRWATQTVIPSLKSVISHPPFPLSDRDIDEVNGLIMQFRILQRMDGRWVCAQNEVGTLIAKVWPGEDAAEFLYPPYVRKIYYMSGTLRPHSMKLLGIPEEEMTFKEWPHPYPAEIRPVIWIPTIRAVERTASESDWRMWRTRIDQIINNFPGKLGLVHTVSYPRAQMVATKSKNKEIMVTHNSKTTVKTVEWFKEQKGNGSLVLVSPVLVAGWDLPEVSYQIIGKIPFPDGRDVLVRARNEDDKTFNSYEAAQDLVQQAGRIVRGPTMDDWGLTIIIDDTWSWFGPKNRDAMPDWFKVEKRNSF